MITIDPPSPSSISPPAPSRSALTRFLHRAQAAVGLPGTVAVLLTTDREIQRLNRTFRRRNKPTDVLSFPAPHIPGLPPAHQHAGDLAISLDIANRQAAEHHHPLLAEVKILLLHGLLHLAGLDHEADKGEMAARESDLRQQLRLPKNLIARTAASPAQLSETAPRKPAKPRRIPATRTADLAPPSSKPAKKRGRR